MKLCECGCGEPAPIAPFNNTRYGWVKGQPKRFVHGHHWRGKKRQERSAEHCQKLSRSRRGKTDGTAHPNWRGGRTRVKQGYVLVKVGRAHPMAAKNGYVMEHRLVMSKHLGRPLRSKEVVHHLNGRKDDNRIENLRLFRNNAQHLRHHGRVSEALAV